MRAAIGHGTRSHHTAQHGPSAPLSGDGRSSPCARASHTGTRGRPRRRPPRWHAAGVSHAAGTCSGWRPSSASFRPHTAPAPAPPRRARARCAARALRQRCERAASASPGRVAGQGDTCSGQKFQSGPVHALHVSRPATAVGTLSEHCWGVVQVGGHAPKQTACRSELLVRRSCVQELGAALYAAPPSAAGSSTDELLGLVRAVRAVSA